MDWNVAGMENIRIIAHIYTDFDEKFGIPRQSGIVKQCRGRIVFEPEYRNEEALAGIDGYSHLWLIWKFSESVRQEWSPTVRPPRLGGVRLEEVITDSTDGPQLIVSGVDMLNKTPIYDIKPYLSYTDSHPEAVCGFADEVKDYRLEVVIPENVSAKLGESCCDELRELLAQDPRPGYRHDESADDLSKIYGMNFSGHNIRFSVRKRILTVISCDDNWTL